MLVISYVIHNILGYSQISLPHSAGVPVSSNLQVIVQFDNNAPDEDYTGRNTTNNDVFSLVPPLQVVQYSQHAGSPYDLPSLKRSYPGGDHHRRRRDHNGRPGRADRERRGRGDAQGDFHQLRRGRGRSEDPWQLRAFSLGKEVNNSEV